MSKGARSMRGGVGGLLALALASAEAARTIQGRWIAVDAGLECNVLNYGAVGDGATDDTAALQKAIDACAATAGGAVLFPSGHVFLSFPLTVSRPASNFSLGIFAGATLRFSNDMKHWPGQQACLTVENANGVALHGGGTVDGQGAVWWPDKDGFRPLLVSVQGTTNLLVQNLTFLNSPNHNLELYANFAEVHQVRILAPSDSPNTDGIDVHGSPFWVHESFISVGDDNVALHSNDTLISDCSFGTGHGASIGSLDVAYLKNITVQNIAFNGTTQAMRIKSDQGGVGFLEDVVYQNITTLNVQTTLVLTMYYQTSPSRTTLQIRNVTFADVTAVNSQSPGEFLCVPESPCEDLVLRNVVHHNSAGSWTCQNAFGSMDNVSPPGCLRSS